MLGIEQGIKDRTNKDHVPKMDKKNRSAGKKNKNFILS